MIGVGVVLVVDPVAQTITAHRSGGFTRPYGVNDAVPCEDVLPGFALPVTAAFE